MPESLLLCDVEVEGQRVDALLARGRISAIGRGLDAAGAERIDGRGGALIPGLHDHHVHLYALAAARDSVAAGPPNVRDRCELASALLARDRALAPRTWIRGWGYHESVAGVLDRHALDALLADRPIRLQHRTGAMWMLNTCAMRCVGIDADAPAGAERDEHGQPNGRLYGLDRWLRERVPASAHDLSAVAGQLTAFGVTGITDATRFEHPNELDALAKMAREHRLADVVVTGRAALPSAYEDALPRGPAKVILADHALPAFEELIDEFATARAHRRPVAVHSVSLDSLLLALAAWEEVGSLPGDRLEHGSVIPPAQAARLAALRITVITQPNFVYERGDQYLKDVEPDELAHLFPCRGLMDAGVPVAFGTDAPFGAPDPWVAIAAAAERRTRAGVPLGEHERIDPRRALECFLGSWDSPAGPPRRVREGSQANLCLLRCSLEQALVAPSREVVAATIVAGRFVSGPH
jgi:predicted amidohydrolase YtcJ